MDRPKWRVTASSYVIDTPHLRLRKDTIELPDGTLVPEYFVRESRGFVVIFALTPEDRVVLVRQYKHGAARVLLELPAGAIDPGEEPLQTALRELAEETGYEAESMELVKSFVSDPTNSDSVAHLFLARNARRTREQDLDVTEDISVELASLDDLHAYVRDGTIFVMPQVAAIYTVLDHLDGLLPHSR
ncbi:MAG TPA: NUDIX hydrolase [Candidatus Baltobacteraceae bacterium]|jgi:8-oxo-dGTP pyrophosphatase MutT (NUDIX family)|nr:NUDIX hydrolase [Candidatus Baltobacteraceae bacterium]